MSGRDEPVRIDFDSILIDDPNKQAVFFCLEEGDYRKQEEERTIWVPRSQLLSLDEESHTFEVPLWFAEARGLI